MTKYMQTMFCIYIQIHFYNKFKLEVSSLLLSQNVISEMIELPLEKLFMLE